MAIVAMCVHPSFSELKSLLEKNCAFTDCVITTVAFSTLSHILAYFEISTLHIEPYIAELPALFLPSVSGSR